MGFLKVFIRWLLISGLVVFAILFISFTVSRMAPGDPVLEHLPPNFTAEQYQEKRNELGLDRPFFEQFLFFYISGLFFGSGIMSIGILIGLLFLIAIIATIVERKIRKGREETEPMLDEN